MASTTSLTDPAGRRPVADGLSPDANLAPPPPPAALPVGAAETGHHAPDRSVSFPATGAIVVGQPGPFSGAEGHGLVGVGPGLPDAARRAGIVSGYPFPITGAKIHPPLLRADTLSRPRLNEWLDSAASGRVALIVAEAGYGKTTLLADWAAATSRSTTWYRLESDDRDWLVFVRHLVAAGREIAPDFGAGTVDLILALGAGGPRQPDVAAAIVREYAEFAAARPEGVTLII